MSSTHPTTGAPHRVARAGHRRSGRLVSGATVLAAAAGLTACGGAAVGPEAAATPTATLVTTGGPGTTTVGTPTAAPAPATSPPVTATSTPATSPPATSSTATPTQTTTVTPTTTRTATPTTTRSPTSTVTATPTATSPATHGADLPAGFAPVSFSATSADRWFLLGTDTTTHARLLTTADAGRSWQDVVLPDLLRAQTGGQDAPGVAFSDARHGLVTVGGGFWATADGGRTWRNGGPGNAEVLEVAAGPGVGYALLHTASGGYFLGRAPAGGVDLGEALGGDRFTTTVPHLATTGTTVVVVSGDRTLRSTDGGRTFTSHRGPCTAELGGRASAAGPTVLAWCATGMAGGAFVSTDRGATFTRTDAGGGNGAAAAPTGSGARFAYAGGTGLRMTGRTGGGTPVRGGIGTVQWVGFSSPDRGFAIATDAAGGSGLWRSVDAGSSWSRVGRS